MSRGDLQEMEVKTQQSKTAVNSGNCVQILCLRWQILALNW